MHELPLIFFTTLIQISIGCFILTAINIWNETKTNSLPIWISFILGMMGLISSIFHLGNPWHIFNTMNNFFTSWMSREVIFVGLYVGLVALNILYFLFKKKFDRTLLSTTAIIGFTTLFVMANIYTNSIFVLWSRVVTYSLFVATALIGGGIIAYSSFNINQKHIKYFLVFVLISILLNCIAYGYLFNYIDKNATIGITEKFIDIPLFIALSVTKGFLLLLGCGMIWLYHRYSYKLNLSILACLLIVAGEFIGRIAYFHLGA